MNATCRSEVTTAQPVYWPLQRGVGWGRVGRSERTGSARAWLQAPCGRGPRRVEGRGLDPPGPHHLREVAARAAGYRHRLHRLRVPVRSGALRVRRRALPDLGASTGLDGGEMRAGQQQEREHRRVHHVYQEPQRIRAASRATSCCRAHSRALPLRISRAIARAGPLKQGLHAVIVQSCSYQSGCSEGRARRKRSSAPFSEPATTCAGMGAIHEQSDTSALMWHRCVF